MTVSLDVDLSIVGGLLMRCELWLSEAGMRFMAYRQGVHPCEMLRKGNKATPRLIDVTAIAAETT